MKQGIRKNKDLRLGVSVPSAGTTALSHYRTIALTIALLIFCTVIFPLNKGGWGVVDAFAGTVELPQTGQTTCYDAAGSVIACANTGQDGNKQAGVAWPDPRFTDNSNGSVTDNLTGLVWLKDANCFGTRNWTMALNDANTLEHGACGLTDGSTAGQWRLPNSKELRSLVDYSKFNPVLPNGHPFTNALSNRYWSSTTDAYYRDHAWSVLMWNGYVHYFYKGNNFYVWPVRSDSGGLLYNLAISMTGTGAGTVTSVSSGIDCGSTCDFDFAENTEVTLTASADAGSTFAGWSGDADCSDGVVTMNADKTCTATFNLAIPIPQKPTALTAKSISSSGIVLNWTDNSDNETGFRLQRKEGGCSSTNTNPWANIATKGANSTTHTNSGLLPETTYSYRIRAYNSAGNSAWSNCASTTTAKSGTPNAPSNLNATSAASSTTNLKWTDKLTDVTSFKIWRKAGANAWALLTTINTPNTSYSDTTAAGNDGTTTYSYYVRACNSSGCSPASTTAVVPYKPTALKATAGTGKVDLTWMDKSNNETGFQIQRKDGLCGSTGWSIIHTTGANATSYSNTGLLAGTYAYRIRALTKSSAAPYAYGYSGWSNCAEVLVPELF